MGEILSFPSRDRAQRPPVEAGRWHILDHVVVPAEGGAHGTVERIEPCPGGPLLMVRLHTTGRLAAIHPADARRPGALTTA